MYRIVVDSALMRGVLNRHLQPREGRNVEIVECHVGPLRQSEGFRCVVQYRIVVRDLVSGRESEQIVSAVSYAARTTQRIWEALASEMSLNPESAPDSLFSPYAYVPGLDVLLQVFPHDHRLSALAGLNAGPPLELKSFVENEPGAVGRDLGRWTTDTDCGCRLPLWHDG